MDLLLLYLEFFQVGLFAVGGGFATLPFLFFMAEDNFLFIQQTGWLSAEQVGTFLAVAQCAPGAIGVNIAAQTGFLYGGIPGAITAAAGIISPAIVVISIVARILQTFKDSKIAAAVFSGLRPAAAGLLCAAAWGVWRLALFYQGGGATGLATGLAWHEIFRWREGIISVVMFVLVVTLKRHPLVYIILGAGAGILLRL